MEVEKQQAGQAKLTPQEQALAVARGLVERASHLLAHGVEPVIVLAFEWIWAEAGFRPGQVLIRMATMADERGTKSRQAAMDNLAVLQALKICPIVEGRPGRYGGTLVYVEDPFDVFQTIKRLDAGPQNEFEFVAQLDAEAAQEISGAAPDVVALGAPQFKCNPGGPQGYIIDAEPKCNPEASQGYIWDFERGDHALLSALLENVVDGIGNERFELWLDPCGFVWDRPRFNLLCPSEIHARMVRGEFAHTIRAAGRDLVAEFDLNITIEPPANLNVTLGALRVTLSAQLTYQPTSSLEHSMEGSNERTNERTEDLISKKNPLLLRAAEIYERLNDPTLFKWIAIALAIRVDQQTIDEGQLEALIAAYHAEGGDIKRCCQRVRIPWTKQYATKNLMRQHYGIKWKREWDQGAEPIERRLPR